MREVKHPGAPLSNTKAIHHVALLHTFTGGFINAIVSDHVDNPELQQPLVPPSPLAKFLMPC